MEFGLNFFPDVSPEQKPARQYFSETLALAELADELGYSHVRMVEHHFHRYGGYSPNPLVFLAAAAQRTRRVRLITGAVLPVFNHPLKLAGEIAMVDAISGGRVEIGFARAFLPHEFERFGRSLDESRARFDEGVSAVTGLLTQRDFSFEGAFHSFPETTSLPRPTQSPAPPLWTAALSSEESFANAGRRGHHLMAIPLSGGKMRDLIAVYRDARRSAGHPGNGRVMLAFHLLCRQDHDQAVETARGPVNAYLESLTDAAGAWVSGTTSDDYPGYDKMITKLREDSFDAQLAAGTIWVGTPDRIVDQISAYRQEIGMFEEASLQVNFNSLPVDEARTTVELFAREVVPRVAHL
ncbi:LLM class flavin-dependent oxidoreductase [Streptomyces blattellae]|uniref:LLM class flavin-dependent oxidoreductase n=1 Tax=Streptomyces blattellae TaxID=2569855 RepID=UPI0012B8ACC1|nr:LLM class flavin-dependent oxidoreductase [Streptomyces blattellae]